MCKRLTPVQGCDQATYGPYGSYTFPEPGRAPHHRRHRATPGAGRLQPEEVPRCLARAGRRRSRARTSARLPGRPRGRRRGRPVGSGKFPSLVPRRSSLPVTCADPRTGTWGRRGRAPRKPPETARSGPAAGLPAIGLDRPGHASRGKPLRLQPSRLTSQPHGRPPTARRPAIRAGQQGDVTALECGSLLTIWRDRAVTSMA
jgi:hypothetical protein